MSLLSQRSVEALIDLVKIKLSCLEVFDKEDAREQSYLRNALRELTSMKAKRGAASMPLRRAAA